jgi:hypothetical protein
MLQSIKLLGGKKRAASDDDIGHVKDFYFDDQDWVVRYVVADTGSWLPGRQVLISPHAFEQLEQTGKTLRVNLTRKQIENSPSIEEHKPVSRQYEEEYYSHYGWPQYWMGDGLWGSSGVPMLKPPPIPLTSKPGSAVSPQLERPDAHLRSARAVNGYHFQTAKGIIGHVCDFMIDAQSWVIDQLVIKTGHRLTGPEVLVPTKDVRRISYEDSTVFADSARDVAEQDSDSNSLPATAGI